MSANQMISVDTTAIPRPFRREPGSAPQAAASSSSSSFGMPWLQGNLGASRSISIGPHNTADIADSVFDLDENFMSNHSALFGTIGGSDDESADGSSQDGSNSDESDNSSDNPEDSSDEDLDDFPPKKKRAPARRQTKTSVDPLRAGGVRPNVMPSFGPAPTNVAPSFGPAPTNVIPIITTCSPGDTIVRMPGESDIEYDIRAELYRSIASLPQYSSYADVYSKVIANMRLAYARYSPEVEASVKLIEDAIKSSRASPAT